MVADSSARLVTAENRNERVIRLSTSLRPGRSRRLSSRPPVPGRRHRRPRVVRYIIVGCEGHAGLKKHRRHTGDLRRPGPPRRPLVAGEPPELAELFSGGRKIVEAPTADRP